MKLILDASKSGTRLPQVLRAALRVFVKKGIGGASIKDIALEAGVSVGALYNHFEGKTELAWYLFSTHLAAFTEELRGNLAAARDVETRIRIFTRTCFATFEEDQELFAYLIINEHQALSAYPPSQAHPGTLATALIEEGQRAGSIKSGNPVLLGAIMTGAIIRMCVTRMSGRVQEDLRTQEDLVAGSVWAALKK